MLFSGVTIMGQIILEHIKNYDQNEAHQQQSATVKLFTSAHYCMQVFFFQVFFFFFIF